MKIGDVVLNITPTADNYQRTPQIFGTMQRDVEHTLRKTNVKVKHVWRLEFYVLDQVGDLVSEAVKTSNITFEDYDGQTYTVLISDLGPVRGYPRADLGKMYIVLEQV
ncbi:MAG: hypothetical protein M0P69_16430 [Bacteroidales bacterium]|nr:hypothetical protein [Bacteroidales bacterium]